MSYHVAAWYFNFLPMLQQSLQIVDTLAHRTAYDRLVMQHATLSSWESYQCQCMSFQCELPGRSLNFICQYYLIKYTLQKQLIELCTWKAANWSEKHTPGSLRFTIPSGIEKNDQFQVILAFHNQTALGCLPCVHYGSHRSAITLLFEQIYQALLFIEESSFSTRIKQLIASSILHLA